MLYVLLAGMKEIAWLNLLNAILMYAALIVVFICLCFKLPGGWNQVEATMTASADTSWMTSIFGNKALIIGFAIGKLNKFGDSDELINLDDREEQ